MAVPPTPQNTMNSIKRERVKASVADPDDHPVYPVIHGKPIQFIGRSPLSFTISIYIV